ncbi:MAG: ABC transporter permease [Chloroflexi bacterium]|nr:ABC transporter permease [Chloroflexota bacterium]
MQRYILARLVQALVMLIVVSVIVFGVARMTGNPVDVYLPVDVSPEQREEEVHRLGLDRPIYVQYGIFVSGLLRGDLGESVKFRKPVSTLIRERLPNTASLVLLAIAIALVLAFPLGIIAALRQGGPWDVAARVSALLGQSVPTFWGGIMLMLVFAVQLGWLPVARKESLASYVLPALTIALFGFMLAGVVRLLRTSLLEVLDSEFVKFARIKGLPEYVVILKHALRNALIPVVTFVGMYFGILLAGSVTVETVFAWPGIGRLAYEAVRWRDYPVIQSVVLVAATIIIMTNLVVDILYGYLDPRIRYGRSG